MNKTFTDEGLKTAELLTFKIMPAKFGESTITTGKVYLGCADYYTYQHEKTGNSGMGDEDEGLFARVNKSNISYLKDQRKLHGDNLKETENGDFIDLKLHTVINMPTYCVYTVNTLSPGVTFEDSDETAGSFRRIIKFSIPERVLQDFSDLGNFAILNFLNHSKLSECIETAIEKEGYTGRTLKNSIRYVDRNEEWCPELKHPEELFFKDRRFEYQSEGRIILLDDEMSFIGKTKSCEKVRPLNIGNLAGMVTKKPIPVSGGLKFKMEVQIHRRS